MSLRVLLRAALLSVALFIFAGVPELSAEVKSKKAETSKDLIEKAYNLSLQKDRAQACTILINAIKQENLHNGNTTELKKALQQVSYMFYSDRAQQVYELALSLRRTDPSQALQKLTEAQRVEADNMTLYTEMQRVLLIKGEASTVLENVLKKREQNPFDEQLVLLQAQALVYLGNWSDYKKLRDAFEIKKSNLQKYWLALDIEQDLYEKSPGKAKEALLAAQKVDAKYPELLYWQWRLAPEGEKKPLGQKYVKGCKNISPTQYRQYMTDVNLCRKVAEVETAIKSSNGSNE